MGTGSKPVVKPPRPARRLSARPWWLGGGILVGALFGTMYGWLGLMLADAVEMTLDVIGTAALLGGITGGLYALAYRRCQPLECSLCTWLGLLLGLVPAVVVLTQGVGMLGMIRRPVSLAGLALGPAMAGFIIGGLLDRFMDPLLFSTTSDASGSGQGDMGAVQAEPGAADVTANVKPRLGDDGR